LKLARELDNQRCSVSMIACSPPKKLLLSCALTISDFPNTRSQCKQASWSAGTPEQMLLAVLLLLRYQPLPLSLCRSLAFLTQIA
jgi:hypothetical protein